MKNRTKFYEILVKARTDEVSMILVIGKIMPDLIQGGKISPG